MKNNDADKLIQSKLENYSVSPPAHVWRQVQQQLENSKRKKRVLWYRFVAAAVLISLAFISGWYFSQSNSGGELVAGKTSAVDQTTGIKNQIETTLPQSRSNEKETSASVGISENDKVFAAKRLENKFAGTRVVAKNNIAENNVEREHYSFSTLKARIARLEKDRFPVKELKKQPTRNKDVELLDFEKLIIDRNLQAMASQKSENGGWKLGMYLTPGYSSFKASHSDEYEQNMTYSGRNGNANVGGGLSVVYKTAKKLMLESGVYYAQNGQKSANTINIFSKNSDAEYAYGPGEITYFSNNVKLENGRMAMNSTAGVIAITSNPKGAELSGEFESMDGNSNLMVPGGEFSQVFEFMEIPVLVRYRVVDARLGVELMTGITTGFLVGNNAYIDNQYGLQKIGKTEDISAVNFSGTVGVGTSYSLGKNLSFALEPRFSYYFNSINNNPEVSFKPYKIGIYTGLTYEF